MEVTFDNKTNVLNARIFTTHDGLPIYSVTTGSGIFGRKVTLIKDLNPLPGDIVVVGAIHWREKFFEVRGQRKAIKDIKRREGRLLKRTRYWRWSQGRKEYQMKYQHEEWKATLSTNAMVAARFTVPFRPHLFTKSEPAAMHLTKAALQEDEVFLILAFIYSEARRQDRTSSSSDVGW